MPVLIKSKWTNIFGGEFVDVQGDVHVHYHTHTYNRNDICNDALGVQEELPLANMCTDRPIPHDARSDSHHEQQQHIAWIWFPLNAISRSISGILRYFLALMR
ncbi:hypothetical protein FA15DRAFT_660231 [Coprinopsis marcescibilis]|uniref:Uncharacterized protein n=1 Tax=Coprinopsis marcescibilis TaxID=230819 RepID=A0A5C3KH49_COPMA|nr:hypothetical protein FA15DRAFT_660231 [Coprinopsis marcescibilis]